MDLKTILENVDKEILNEETLSKIQNAFNESVNNKVEERLELEVESALIEMDEDHSVKLEQLIESIDEDHTKKLNKVVEAMESNYTQKLKNVINKYESELNESASKHIDFITEEISNYLDAYLEKLIPTDKIYEAAKNDYAKKVLTEAKSILGVDEKYVSKQFKEAVKDGAEQINKLKEENKALKQRQQLLEANNLLNKLTENMTIGKANFIKRRLQGKSVETIKENFKYVENMYKSKSKNSDLLQEKTHKPSVDRQLLTEGDVVLESNETPNVDDDPMDYYVSFLDRQ